MISAAVALLVGLAGVGLKFWLATRKSPAQTVEQVDHAMLDAAVDHKPAAERLRDHDF